MDVLLESSSPPELPWSPFPFTENTTTPTLSPDGVTVDIDSELFHKHAPLTYNLKVQVTYHQRTIIDIHPEMSYAQKDREPEAIHYGFHLSHEQLTSESSTEAAVDKIVRSRLKLDLTKEDCKQITDFIECAKTRWTDGIPVIVVAHVDVFKKVVAHADLPEGALVPVEFKEHCCTCTCTEKTCWLCMKAFVQGAQVFETRCCGQIFHEKCIMMSLVEYGDCPICQLVLIPNVFYSVGSCGL